MRIGTRLSEGHEKIARRRRFFFTADKLFRVVAETQRKKFAFADVPRPPKVRQVLGFAPRKMPPWRADIVFTPLEYPIQVCDTKFLTGKVQVTGKEVNQ